MAVNLVKGQKINLSKEIGGLKKVIVGLGWDAKKEGLFRKSVADIDCDASVIILNNDDTYRNTVYYGNRSAEKECIVHHGDNLTGVGSGDDERITVDLPNMPDAVGKIVFAVNIYRCIEKCQDFGMIRNAYIRLVESDSSKEICRYNLTDDYKDKTAMIFGELYKKDSEWRFNAIGQGTEDRSITEICNRYK